MPSGTIISARTRRIIPLRASSTTTSCSACRSTRSSPWRPWWERAASSTSTPTAKVRRTQRWGTRWKTPWKIIPARVSRAGSEETAAKWGQRETMAVIFCNILGAVSLEHQVFPLKLNYVSTIRILNGGERIEVPLGQPGSSRTIDSHCGISNPMLIFPPRPFFANPREAERREGAGRLYLRLPPRQIRSSLLQDPPQPLPRVHQALRLRPLPQKTHAQERLLREFPFFCLPDFYTRTPERRIKCRQRVLQLRDKQTSNEWWCRLGGGGFISLVSFKPLLKS